MTSSQEISEKEYLPNGAGELVPRVKNSNRLFRFFLSYFEKQYCGTDSQWSCVSELFYGRCQLSVKRKIKHLTVTNL